MVLKIRISFPGYAGARTRSETSQKRRLPLTNRIVGLFLRRDAESPLLAAISPLLSVPATTLLPPTSSLSKFATRIAYPPQTMFFLGPATAGVTALVKRTAAGRAFGASWK